MAIGSCVKLDAINISTWPSLLIAFINSPYLLVHEIGIVYVDIAPASSDACIIERRWRTLISMLVSISINRVHTYLIL